MKGLKHIRCVVVFHILAASVFAQTIADVQRFQNFTDAAEQITYITNIKEVREAERFFDSKQAGIESQLQWSQEAGYLIEIRIQDSSFGAERVQGHPMLLGVGTSPVDVYAKAYSEPMLYSAEPSPGMRYAQDKSFFLWAELRKPWWRFGRPILQVGVIPPGPAQTVRDQGTTLIADALVIQVIGEEQGRRVLMATIERLRQQSASAQLALELQAHADKLMKQREERSIVINRLNSELKRNENAANLLRTLDQLGSVLSVATMWSQATAALDDLPASPPAGASSAEDIKNVVSQYQQGKALLIDQQRTRQALIEADVMTTTGAIKAGLQKGGVPDSVQATMVPLLKPKA